jgi:hypothetical protein
VRGPWEDGLSWRLILTAVGAHTEMLPAIKIFWSLSKKSDE